MTTEFKSYIKSIYIFIQNIILSIIEIKSNQDLSSTQKQKMNLNTTHNREPGSMTKNTAYDYKSPFQINQRSKFSSEETIKQMQRIVILHDYLQNNQLSQDLAVQRAQTLSHCRIFCTESNLNLLAFQIVSKQMSGPAIDNIRKKMIRKERLLQSLKSVLIKVLKSSDINTSMIDFMSNTKSVKFGAYVTPDLFKERTISVIEIEETWILIENYKHT